jgi:hypothetical protein
MQRWKLTIPLMLALVTAPFALGGAGPTETALQATENSGAAIPRVPDDLSGDARTMEIVRVVGAAQLRALGEEPVHLSVPSYASLAEALATLAARHGSVLPLGDQVALGLMDPVLDAALTDVVAAFLLLETEAQAAFGSLDPAAVRADPASLQGTVRLARVVAAQELLLDAALSLKAVLATDVTRPLVALGLPGVFALDVKAACSDDLYVDDMALIIDECGDDRYLNNAGGASISVNDGWCGGHIAMAAAALLDHGGDDFYGNGARNCGTNGGGFGGAGFLYDEAGHDSYNAGEGLDSLGGNDGTNGGAVVGAGLLVDETGDDRYIAGGWGTNGGGYPGARALLLDNAGNDFYAGTYEAVNGGGLFGAGALWDDGGDDRYVAWQTGVNGGAAGGFGLLYDRIGTDVYSDDAGGSGVDITIVPKEVNGAQVDDS